jgi:hypothetical protein
MAARLEGYNGNSVYVSKAEYLVEKHKRRLKYRAWTTNEIYSLMLAVKLFGHKNSEKLEHVMNDRSIYMVRNLFDSRCFLSAIAERRHYDHYLYFYTL